MGSGPHALAHGGLPCGEEARQQHRGLDLCARHLGDPGDPVEAAARHGQGREAACPAAGHPGAHGAQGRRDPVHGAGGEGRVAHEDGHACEPGCDPCEEPHARAGVPAVEGPERRVQEAATAGDRDHLAVVVHLGAERRDGVARAAHVVTVREAPDQRRALPEGAHDERTVRDGLVARHPQLASEGRAPCDQDRLGQDRPAVPAAHEIACAVAWKPRAPTPSRSLAESSASTTRRSTPRGPSGECAISMS